VTRSRTVPVLIALVAAALSAAAALWLAYDNPDIDGTSRGPSYTCLAPWDTVLNDADNVPGGEPPADAADIATRCRDAGQDRFRLAMASGISALVLTVVAGTAGRQRDRAHVGSAA
jgi:hypothetical protein